MKGIINRLKKAIYFLLITVIALPISLLGAGAGKALAAAVSGDVVINEIMWMGSTASSVDEWVELRNTTAFNIDISGWVIEGAASGGGNLTVPASQTILANGYYLISNYAKDHASSVLDVDVDWQTADISLSNSNMQYILKDEISTTIDIAGDGATPFAGDNTNKYSMERIVAPGDGTLAADWQTSNNRQGFDVGALDRGTPGQANSDTSIVVSDPTGNVVAPASPTNVNTPNVLGATVHTAGTTEIVFDDGTIKNLFTDIDVTLGTYDITTSILADGAYSITAYNRDAAGHFSPGVSVETNYVIDTAAPVFASSDPVDGATLTASPTQITATFTEDGSGVDSSGLGMTIDGAPVTASYDGATKTLTHTPPTALSDGTYAVEITGLQDLAGNITTPNPSFAFTVNVPVINLTSEIINDNLHTNNPEVNFLVKVSANTPGFYIYYNKDSNGWQRYGGLRLVDPSKDVNEAKFNSKDVGGDGDYGFYSVAADANGSEVEGAPLVPDVQMTFDTNPPATPIGYMVPGSPSMDNTPTAMGEISSDTKKVWVDFTSHDGAKRITVNAALIDGKRYEATPSAEQALADGAYEIIAYAEDYLGNGSMYVIATDFVVDTIPVNTPINISAISAPGMIYLEWEAIAEVSNYMMKYRRTGQEYTEPVLILEQNKTQITGLEDGVEYEFAIASIDEAGNISDYSSINALIGAGGVVTISRQKDEYPTGGPAIRPDAPVIVITERESQEKSKVQESQKPTIEEVTGEEGEPVEITPIEPEELDQGLIKSEAEEAGTTRNWTRIIVAISILIIAIGVGTGGWYAYQWWIERGKPMDKGKDISGKDNNQNKDKDKKDQGGRW